MMRRFWFGLVTAGCAAAAVSFIGCGDTAESPTGSGTGGSSSSGTGATGGTGGMGGMHHTGGSGGTGGGCATPSDCGTDTDCHKFTCNAGMCGEQDVPAGTAATDATAMGDCKKTVCDGMGSTTTADDDGDFSDDGEACTVDACSAGMGTHLPTASGTACSDGVKTLCDGAGACVECLTGTDCTMSGVCQQNACVPGECGNNMKDGGETDVDCGGPLCGGCDDNEMCIDDADCQSGVCTSGLCQAPECDDNVQNGVETGTDCGGGGAMACPACGTGEGCAMASDCVSGVCIGNPLQCQMATCSDGVENGGETDIDCGGPCAKKCGPGAGCLGNGDCAGGLCTGMMCAATCTDGVKNNAETGTDCGGGACPACPLGQACLQPADCTSTLCISNVCSQINGCDPATAESHLMQGSVSVAFGGGAGLAYLPKCLKVSAGTMVTFTGDMGASFASHPFQGGEIKNFMANPVNGPPYGSVTNSGTMKTFNMAQPGSFPYYCANHWPANMYGAVFVVP